MYWLDDDGSDDDGGTKTMTGVKVIQTVPQAIPHNTVTAINFDTALWDDSNFFNPANPGFLTIPHNGRYVAFGFSRIQNASAGPILTLQFAINGNTFASQTIIPINGSSQLNLAMPFAANALDTVTCEWFQNSGIARNTEVTLPLRVSAFAIQRLR